MPRIARIKTKHICFIVHVRLWLNWLGCVSFGPDQPLNASHRRYQLRQQGFLLALSLRSDLLQDDKERVPVFGVKGIVALVHQGAQA